MTKYLSAAGLQTVIDGIMNRVAHKQHTHNAEDIDSGTLDSNVIPFASSSSIGGVMVGSGLSIDPLDGTLSASVPKQVVASASTPINSDAIIWIKTN